MGFGLAACSGDLRWAIAGFALALGWGLLGLHNDCRYKAFFQRLKSTTACYRVDGGSGGSPQPPAPWPRRGRAIVTWPAYKACESHVVLLGLTALALAAIASGAVWLALWRGWVLVMAVLAPLLAIGRITRSVSQQSTEAEFTRWFQPLGRAEHDESRPAFVDASTPRADR